VPRTMEPQNLGHIELYFGLESVYIQNHPPERPLL
jgi:hypothetical protein